MSAGGTVVRAAAESVRSPCNSVCRIDPASGWCVGCWRTIDEIVAWGSMDEAGKRMVWQRLTERRERAGPFTDGKAAAEPAR